MENSDQLESTERKKRGKLLSAFLILMIIANAATAFTYFANPEAITKVYPSLSESLLYFMGVLALINFLLTIAIWFWKRIGLYGIYITSALAFCINLYAGLGLVNALVGLIGALFLFVITKNRWHNFS